MTCQTNKTCQTFINLHPLQANQLSILLLNIKWQLILAVMKTVHYYLALNQRTCESGQSRQLHHNPNLNLNLQGDQHVNMSHLTD
jgi:hypothetical protein